MTTTCDMPAKDERNDSSKPKRKKISLMDDIIRLDGGTQSRVKLHQATVAEYAEAIRAGVEFPPVVVFNDGIDIWLADGFHRYHAHLTAEATGIDCEVHEGAQRDAILYSVRANATHGLRRSNEDKRKAVLTLLNDAEWVQWTDVAIAKACGVSDKTVAAQRSAILGNSEDGKPAKRKVTRNGKTFEQTTPSRRDPTPATDWPFQSAEDQAAAPSIATPRDTVDTAPSAVIIDNEQSRDVIALIEENAGLKTRMAALEQELEAVREDYAAMAQDMQEIVDDNERMRKAFEADDQIGAALAQVKQLQDLNRVMQTRMDGLMNEKVEVLRRYKAAKRNLEKLQKQHAELPDEHADLKIMLKNMLAENEMLGRVCDADDKIKAALDEARRYRAVAEQAARTLAARSGEFIELARAVTT